MSQKPPVQPFGLLLSVPVVWAVMLGLLAARLTAIGLSPLGPGVDEAQYWLWGQTPQLGYYSKPPLIAWILAASGAVTDSAIFGLRGLAPVLHLTTAVLLWQTGRVLLSARAGRLAAVLWASLPAVGLGSFVMSTDTPMLLFWSAGLLCFAKMVQSPRTAGLWLVCCGICVGLAALSKYAGLYFIIGVLIWCLTDKARTAGQRAGLFALFCGAVFITSLPTWLWNFNNGFVTLLHLGENANLQDTEMSAAGIASFWGAQFAVFGPVLLVLLGWALFLARRGGPPGRLSVFVWPVLAIMTVQAFMKEANANWAVAAYPAATLMVSQAVLSARSRFLPAAGQAALLVNLGLCAGLIAVTATGRLGPLAPASDPLRHLRGWDQLAKQTEQAARDTGARTIIAFDRESAALLHWHLAGTSTEIVLARLGPGAGNHYHRTYPLRPQPARPLLALTDTPHPPDHLPVRAGWRGPVATSEVQISRRDSRRVWFWQAE